MPRNARTVPDENALLCEGCGYTLSGLPLEGNCPECGKPIAESVGSQRQLTEYEQRPQPSTFWKTSVRLLTQPTAFYQTLQTRSSNTAAEKFAWHHRVIAAALFAASAIGHYGAVYADWRGSSLTVELLLGIAFWLALSMFLLAVLIGINLLATWLSVIESRYWGMRLPQQVVQRGMAFHTADYLPVGLVAVVIVWGYRLLLALIPTAHQFDLYYLYVLSGFVIVGAAYLFRTYWIGMRNMMYANR